MGPYNLISVLRLRQIMERPPSYKFDSHEVLSIRFFDDVKQSRNIIELSFVHISSSDNTRLLNIIDGGKERCHSEL